MVRGAVAELVVGVKRDEGFGLALVIGSGGNDVEMLDDYQALLLPAPEDDIRLAIHGLRTMRRLAAAQVAVAGIVAAVMTVARFAESHAAQLVELDVNPLLVLPGTAGVVAVDALIWIADDGASA